MTSDTSEKGDKIALKYFIVLDHLTIHSQYKCLETTLVLANIAHIQPFNALTVSTMNIEHQV